MPKDTTVSASSLDITMKARQLFREEKFDELLQHLTGKELSAYLLSLQKRAQEQVEKKTSTEVVMPVVDAPKTEQKSEEKNFLTDLQKKAEEKRVFREKQLELAKMMKKEFESKKTGDEHLPKSTVTLNSLEKLKFERDQKKKIEEMEGLLVQTLEKRENLLKENIPEAEKQIAAEQVAEQEMKLAQNVQAKLLPNIDKKILPGMDTFVKTVSASELSGDVYDFVSNEEETFFYIGDVTGHGTAAGLVMTMISCLAHSIILRTNNLVSILSTLNKEIKPKLQKNMFTTMIVGKWHAALREFSFIGAGHEYILHFSALDKTVKRIKSGGIAIGMLADISKIVKEEKIHLENGDVLLFYTDGLDEAWDAKKEHLFGLDRLVEVFQREATLQERAEDIGVGVLDRVRMFQGKELTDDMTIIVLKRLKSGDEENIRNAYLKKSLEKEILHDEVLIESKNESFSPELSSIQDDLVEKARKLAVIQMEEKDFYAARETLYKGLKLSPGDTHLKDLSEKVEAMIFSEEGGFLGMIRKFFYSFLQKQKQKFEAKRAALLADYYHEAEKALKNGDIKRAEDMKQLIQSLDPQSSYLKKLEKSFQEAKKTVLEKYFSLNPMEEKKEQKVPLVEPAKKKEEILFKSTSENQEKQIENFLEFDVDADYSPSAVINNNDILGLKSLLKLKDSFVQREEIQGLERVEKAKDPEALKMEWVQGGALERKRKPYNKFMAMISPMNSKDLFDFIQKLSAFVKAGIPLQKSLEIIQEQAINDGYIFVLDEINKSLDEGKMLSEAMEQFPKAFPEMLRYLVVAGEKSGALSLILADLAEKMKEQQMISARIKGAMIYPSVIIVASLGMITAMLIFIVPRLTKIYRETGVQLPKITEFIVSLSEFVQHNYITSALMIVAAVAGIYFFGKTSVGEKIYHKLFLGLPVVRSIAMQNNTMLFTSNIAILLENGIQLAEALNVVSRIVPNYYYKQEIIELRKKMIAEGIPLSKAMGIHLPYSKRSKLFPLEVIQAVAIGEETGGLARVLGSSGEMFKERLKSTVKGISELMEPFLMIFVGLVVATILLSIMLPLFNLGKVLRQQ